MYQTSHIELKKYFSEAELNFIIMVLRGQQCELLGFIAEMIKATNSMNHDKSGTDTDFDPITIVLKLSAMPHDVAVDLHTRLKRFREFPDANYCITKRLQEVGLLEKTR